MQLLLNLLNCLHPNPQVFSPLPLTFLSLISLTCKENKKVARELTENRTILVLTEIAFDMVKCYFWRRKQPYKRVALFLFSWVCCFFVFSFLSKIPFVFNQNFYYQTEWGISFTSSLKWRITNLKDQKKDGLKNKSHPTPHDKVQFLKGLWGYKGEKNSRYK